MQGATTRDFMRLVVWQKSHQLVLWIYQESAAFPKSQLYSLTNQMQRAAVSIPANIAEGCGRRGTVELARFMTIAQGSAAELAYYLILARDLGFLPIEIADRLSARINEINRMLTAYIGKLKANG